MAIRGRVWKYGDDVNTDVIFPGKYTYTVTDPREMAAHALEDLDPTFAPQVRPGDIVVGGKNFGCGSSREQAAFCLKYAGCGAVVAVSFARLFYRNAINAGLPMIECPQAARIAGGETIDIDLDKAQIRCAGGTFAFPPLSEFVLGILREGDIVEYVKKKIQGGC